MSEILSQDEINALLSAYASPEAATGDGMPSGSDKEVRLYDFTRPDKFSKEHLRTLNSIHGNFASSLAMTLSVMYQLPTKINLIGIDQISYKEYQTSIPSKTLLVEVSAEPVSQYILFEVNPSIVGMWVDYLCGGESKLCSKASNLTRIDIAVAKRILGVCLQAYGDSWSGTIPMHPELRCAADSESYDQVLIPSETVLVCSLEISAGDLVGMMTICIPAIGLESVLPKLCANRSALASGPRDKAASARIRKLVDSVSIPCHAVLGEARIPFSEAMGLKVGDVIRTNRRADAEIELRVGDARSFGSRPGMINGNMAVLISSPIRNEVGENGTSDASAGADSAIELAAEAA